MDYRTITSHTLYLLPALLLLFLFTGGCSGQFTTNEPTLQDALDASAADLALSYLSMKHTVRFVAVAERTPVTIGNVTINKNNIDEYKAKYEGRLSVYEQAIRQRGFKQIGGEYQGRATESCARSNSLFAGILEEQKQAVIVITQDNIDAQVVITVEQDGKEISLAHPAAVAESAVAVNEAANSDYYFRGEINNSTIVFIPDLMVLKTWPKWASPPSRNDLKNCVITLEKR